MEKLKKLQSLCKASISVYINEHKDDYSNAKEYIDSYRYDEEINGISERVLQAMIETNTIIEVIFHPNTPVGYYKVWHYDLDLALDECLKIIS